MYPRRAFLKLASALGVGFAMPSLGAISSCSSRRDIPVVISGPDHTRGHRLRGKQKGFSQVRKSTHDVVIIGAGISGLSTAYFLGKKNIQDIRILELNDHPGGNSSFGTNAYSSYPHGAHYINQPNTGNTQLISFLHEKGIITEIDEQGSIRYNDTDLCFDPDERLFLKGMFQDGLIPSYSLRPGEVAEISEFLKLMEFYKFEQGNDGRFFFDIPYSAASTDTTYDALDAMSFRDFLSQKGFTGEYLLWYLDYCCRDDFGGGIDRVSAWAGINYFASHRPHPSNTDRSRVLTWPEGNGRLMNLLFADVQDRFMPGCLVQNISMGPEGVLVRAADFSTDTALEITCQRCVLAIPPFVAARILDAELPYPRQQAGVIQHAPWAVASVILSAVPHSRGLEISWDNIAYRTRSLGYIYNQHQSLKRYQDKISISLYLPLDEKDFNEERKALLARSADEWRDIVLSELDAIHSGISELVEEINVWRWGHGMAMPAVGLVKGGVLQELARPIGDRIFFAHTDLTGYSTFEEGFDWGYRTAQSINLAAP